MNVMTWQEIISNFTSPHILQTWQWGEVKSQTGWKPIYQYWGSQDAPDAAALILKRSIMIGKAHSGLTVLYVPKGPLLRDWGDQQLVQQVVNDLKDIAREQRAIFIKIDPDVPIGKGIPGLEGAIEYSIGTQLKDFLVAEGWLFSREQVQFRNTVRVDLSKSKDQLMAGMKSKTRYNIRLAGRKGVEIRNGNLEDLDLLYQLYVETSLRDGFIIRDEHYYKNLWTSFMTPSSPVMETPWLPQCEPIIAEVDGIPVAAVVIFSFAGTAYYMHGMSKRIHREKMPNYLLQWEAMIRAKEMGCKFYDFWGAPDTFTENDPMWGVFRFKQGFNGEVIRTMGAYDLPVHNLAYLFYTMVLPKALDVMRYLGRKRSQRRMDVQEI
jgi:lipid II:glycine glycyltransferase (peptidoglycan interpeptide bridge formation enzyme)